MIMLLAGCSDGASIDIGGGQVTDPGTVDFPIAYVKRSVPLQQDDLRDQRGTVPDAAIGLFMRNRASPSSTETNVTAAITEGGLYDIKDVDVSQDGQRIVFAMRGPLAQNQDERDPPTWDIWEFVIERPIGADNPRRVIPTDTTAEEGHDISPQYLPDGRIVFSSTRQRQSKAILRDEGKPGFEAQAIGMGGNESAFLLHVMNGDGSDVHQITFNQSHDLWPSVLTDGRLLFTRWDAATGRGMHLYTSNPDGTDLQLLYGARSHATGTPGPDGPTTIQFSRPREMQDGRVLTLVRPFSGTDFGGDLVLIDTRNYVENTQPLATNAGMTGPAQSRATPALVSLVEGPSVGGRFRSAFPLWDGSNRLLVSWSLCRLLDNAQAPAMIVPCTADRLNAPDFDTRYGSAPPLYSAFVYDPADNTFRPLFQPEEGVMITDLVAAQPRAPQTTILDRSIAGDDFDPSLIGEGLGVIEIRNVHDFDGTLRTTQGLPEIPASSSTAMLADPLLRSAAQRPARFLRIEKAVSLGDDQLDGFPDLANQAFGAAGFMREIIGYAPIEPDGSVSVRVPADVAFVMSILDANGQRLFPQHRAWLQVRPGEIRRCAGCHQTATGNAQDQSHGRGRYDLSWMPEDATSGMVDAAWGAAGSGTPFPNTLALTAANAVPGDTMAQARARTSCIAGNPCSQRLSVNVIFDDVWTDPGIPGATPAESFAWTYGPPGLSTPAPVRPTCSSNWNSTCRVIINYVEHIQPIWTLDRGASTCTNCHAPPTATGLMAAPAGQLDLSGDASAEEQLHVVSYRELFFTDGVEDYLGGVLVPRTRQQEIGTDPETGAPIFEEVPVNASRPMIAGNARGSRFFDCLTGNNTCGSGDPDEAGGTENHIDFLTPSELRLISEWVDIGAQYFNNPFANGIPTN